MKKEAIDNNFGGHDVSSVGVKSWLANKGITFEWFLPMMLHEFE